jgi:serine/threonine protein kinase
VVCYAISPLQGGVTLLLVLSVAHQVALGLQHLHSLGIIHRDGRASNVLLASLDPVIALLADLGVSHRLAAFLGDAVPVEAPSKMGSYLKGDEVKGPFLWGAPEVIAGTRDRTATTFATDVYIFGGLLYEMLTGGQWPFHWLAGNASSFALLRLRRQSAEPVPVPAPDGSVHLWPGLLNKSVLEAAELDRVRIPWCVNTVGSPGSQGRLEELKAVMAQCLAADPGSRPKLPALGQQLAVLQAAEAAEAAQALATSRRLPRHAAADHPPVVVQVLGTTLTLRVWNPGAGLCWRMQDVWSRGASWGVGAGCVGGGVVAS